MAETGGTGGLTNEVDAAIEAGTALSVIRGSGLGSPASITIGDVMVTMDHPLVTLVSMIAPSPDWFAGVSGQSLLDGGGRWVDSLTVSLDPYDAGSDSGTRYTSPNEDTRPKEAIHSLRGVSPFADRPVGTFTFVRTDG